MEPIRLTSENEDILREYYINLYIIELKDKDIYIESMNDEIIETVDFMIKRYKDHGDIKASFPKYMTNYNPIYLKYRIKLILTSKRVELIRNGETKYLETLIDYQKNVFRLNYKLFVLENNLEFNKEILEKGLDVIETSIRKYFDENIKTNFTVYFSGIVQKFYFNNNLKTESFEKNIIIDTKNGDTSNINELYEKYYSIASRRIENNTSLPEEKFQKFLRKIVEDKVDKYFCGEEKMATLRNNFEQFIFRLNGEPQKIIVKYNLLFNDFYDESISFIEKSIKEYISTYIKENNINDVKIIYRLTSKVNKIAKDYLDSCKKSNRYNPFNTAIKAAINALVNVKPINVGFEAQNVINGDLYDKANEKEILREQLLHLKDIVKEKYTFYADEKAVDKKIDKDYNKIIESYINNMYLTKRIPAGKPATSYIATRLSQNIKTYANSTKRRFEKNKTERALCFEYFSIINNYIEEHDFSDEELDVFYEYMGNTFETYVKKGSYNKELYVYLIELIDNYDQTAAKEIIETKKYIDSNINVLRHPKTK